MRVESQALHIADGDGSEASHDRRPNALKRELAAKTWAEPSEQLLVAALHDTEWAGHA